MQVFLVRPVVRFVGLTDLISVLTLGGPARIILNEAAQARPPPAV